MDGRAPELTARSSWRHRVRGSVMLAACGDGLGVPFEGRTEVDPAEVKQLMTPSGGGLRCSDDTVQLLVVAEHLAQRRGLLAEDDLAAALAAQWRRDPDRGYGSGAARQLAQVAEGMPWWEAAGLSFGGQGSLGNGAAMRVAPVGLLPGLGFGSVAALARRSAAVTHAHMLGQDGAVAQAVAVALAARSTPGEPIDVDRMVAVLASQVRASEFRAALGQVAALVRLQATPVQVEQVVGADATALGSVPAALTAFLRYPDDPQEVIRFAICVGGDTDTIASMAGALAGARCAEQALPVAWLNRLDLASRVWSAASGLAELHQVSGRG